MSFQPPPFQSLRKLASAVALAALLIHAPRGFVPGGHAQSRALPDAAAVLQSVAQYLDWYESAVADVVAEEDYRQEFLPAFGGGTVPQIGRRLTSDIIVVTDPSFGLAMFRDVFQVDGRPVRDRQDRLTALFERPSTTARENARAIAAESARYNIDVNDVSVARTLNVPLSALLFVRGPFQARSTFSVTRIDTVARRQVAVLAFTEQSLPRIIASPTNLPMKGTVWADLESGAVLRTALDYTLATRTVATTVNISVTYARNDALELWLPSTMSERYQARRAGQAVGTLQGEATYLNFRRFAVDVSAEQLQGHDK